MASDDQGRGLGLLDRAEVDGVLSGSFYSPRQSSGKSAPRKGVSRVPERPAHYKVICISLYKEDLQRLDAMVDALKERGLTKANRSALIRHALSGVDLDTVPRGL